MTTRQKLWVFVLLAAAILAIVGLSASITGMELPAGEVFSLEQGLMQTPGMSGLSPEGGAAMTAALRVLLTLIIALLPFSIIYLIISPDARRKVLPNIILLILFIVIAHFIRRNTGEGRTVDLGALSGNLSGEEQGNLPTPDRFSGDVPSWLTAAMSFVLALFVVLLSSLLGWSLYRRRRREVVPAFVDQVAEEAQTALDAIQAGGDLRSTIIRCYQEMNRAVREARGLTRPEAMTAREFETQLERAGLPAQPVHDLTRLFEEVRYGGKELGPWEERRAVACLTAIAEHVKAGPDVYVPDEPGPGYNPPRPDVRVE
jgi:hypothetical protein